MITGRDLVTKEKVNRWVETVGIVPVVGKFVKVGVKAAKGYKVVNAVAKTHDAVVSAGVCGMCLLVCSLLICVCVCDLCVWWYPHCVRTERDQVPHEGGRSRTACRVRKQTSGVCPRLIVCKEGRCQSYVSS